MGNTLSETSLLVSKLEDHIHDLLNVLKWMKGADPMIKANSSLLSSLFHPTLFHSATEFFIRFSPLLHLHPARRRVPGPLTQQAHALAQGQCTEKQAGETSKLCAISGRGCDGVSLVSITRQCLCLPESPQHGTLPQKNLSPKLQVLQTQAGPLHRHPNHLHGRGTQTTFFHEPVTLRSTIQPPTDFTISSIAPIFPGSMGSSPGVGGKIRNSSVLEQTPGRTNPSSKRWNTL